MALIQNNQSFNAGASGIVLSSINSLFKNKMDTVLLGGRDITLHLPPEKTVCPGSCKFNSTYNKYIGLDGKACRTCKGEGFILEHRYTIYKANIRWINESLSDVRGGGEDTPAGRLQENLVRIKTQSSAINHMNQSLGATIDGISCILWEQPRPHGWGGQVFYCTSMWKANK